MTFYLDEVNDYFGRAYFYCPEKELDFSVDISGAFDSNAGDYDGGKVEEIVSKAFGEAFGEGVEWKY